MTSPPQALVNPDLFESLPFPIAACCELFNDFVSRGEIVAAWLEARDVYEIVTKLSAAALIAEEATDPGSPTATGLVARLLAKSLSFGDWVNLLRDAAAPAKNLTDASPQFVGPILYDVVFFRTAKRKDREGRALRILREAVTWRNDEIGHGALGRKSERLHTIVAEQAVRISELLTCMSPLAGLRLVARADDGSEIDLTGPGLSGLSPESKPSCSTLELYFVRTSDRRAVRVHPLVLLEVQAKPAMVCVTVFDKRIVSSKGRPKADVFLDYDAGRKLVMTGLPTRALEASSPTLGAELADGSCRLAETLDANRITYSASLYERIQQLKLGLDDGSRFVRPPEPVGLILEWLDAVPCGYLHIIGEAGVGKSWLAGNLKRADVLGNEYANAVLTFHAGFGPAQSQAVFVSELGSQARRNFDRMQAILAEETDPEAARGRMVRFLSELAAWHPSEIVILVFDGMDEIVDVPSRNVSILDFLPAVPSLPEGTHIILLSRPPAEFSETARRAVVRLKESATDTPDAWREVEIDATSTGQEDLVRRIIADRLGGTCPEVNRLVAQMSGGIPLRAAHLCTLVMTSDAPPTQLLRNVGAPLAALYSAYFGHLEHRVGQTWFTRLYRPIIAVLAVTRDPLAMEALSEVLDVRTEHIYLASLDLADCLRTRRYAGESTVFLEVSHTELRRFVRDNVGMWEEGHSRLAQCFLSWWRHDWLAQPDSRAEQYATDYLPVHLVGARSDGALEEVLVESLKEDPPHGLKYVKAALDGLHSHERTTAMDVVRDRLGVLHGVLGRVHEQLQIQGALSEQVSATLHRTRIQVVASLADRYAHSAPERALEYLAQADELANKAAADLKSQEHRSFTTQRAVLSYKLHENLRSAGRSDDARQALCNALRLRTELAVSADDPSAKRMQLTAVVWCHLGLAGSAGIPEAEKSEHLGHAESVLRDIERLAVDDPAAAESIWRLQAVVASNLASIHREDRLELLERAVSSYRRARETSPEDRHLEYSVASAERNLAYAYLEDGRIQDALVHVGDAECIVKDLLEYEEANAFYIRLDAQLSRLRARLKLTERSWKAARERMEFAVQRIERAATCLKSGTIQREVETFRAELEAMETAKSRPTK
jgi:tetratricopeptide (TPR) repeat protein